MSIYVLLHGAIVVICMRGLFKSWRVLKKYPSAINFAKWPLSLLIVLMTCSIIAIIDLGLFDIITNQILNVLGAVQLLYSAVVAANFIPFIVRVNRVW